MERRPNKAASLLPSDLEVALRRALDDPGAHYDTEPYVGFTSEPKLLSVTVESQYRQAQTFPDFSQGCYSQIPCQDPRSEM